jgi:60 kDa SS-A/Ro ribonucleoprotein
MNNNQHMSSYSRVISNMKNTGTKRGQAVPRKGHEAVMISNSAGGVTYGISDEDLIDRILILGTSGNSYYSTAEKLTSDSIDSVKRMVAEGKGQMVVDHLRSVYNDGRAPKQDPTFFVLALLTQSDIPLEVRKAALQIVTGLRTFSQLYSWVALKKQLGSGQKGFGRATRSALLELFKTKTGQQLVYQGTKYTSRKCGTESWSIADVISCGHIPSKVLPADSQVAIAYMVKGLDAAQKVADTFVDTEHFARCSDVMQYLNAVEVVKKLECTSDTAIQFIRQYHLPREVLSTHLLNDVNIWKSLLYTTNVSTGGQITHRVTMPITALIRNLGVMSSRGIFDDAMVTKAVVGYLTNQNALRNGRVHPVALLLAKLTYQSGHGLKGKLSWPVSAHIVQALEDGFYLAFGNIEGTGKRILHAVDCSGSMTAAACAVPHLTACQAVSTLVMEAVRREHKHHQAQLAKGENSTYVQDVMLFNNTGTYVTILPTDKLDETMKKVQANNFGSTDCAQPMIKALEKFKKSKDDGKYDLFVVYTDNETWFGNVHPSEALDNYRSATGIDAKMVVVATTPTSNSIGFGGRSNSILDMSNTKNNSPLALNIVGFDLNAPTLIKNFASGTLGTVEESGIEEYEMVEDV